MEVKADLPEDRRLVLRTVSVAHDTLTPALGNPKPSLASTDSHTHDRHTNINKTVKI